MATELRSTAQLGSWTICCDIAGQMSEQSDATVMSLAAVAIGREVVPAARRKLVRDFGGKPVKWKAGGLGGLQHVVGLIATRRFPVVVSHVHRGEPANWIRFFDQAKAFMAEAEQHLGDRPAYLQADATLRMHLLGTAFAKLIGRILRARHPWNRDRPAILDLELILDTDIPSQEARDWYTKQLEDDWSQRSRIISELNVRPKVEARFAAEEDEPLLLLPDYLAGVYLHADPRARLGHPIVSPIDASAAVLEFRRRHEGYLFEDSEDFDAEFPLAHDKNGHVVQRDTGRPAPRFIE